MCIIISKYLETHRDVYRSIVYQMVCVSSTMGLGPMGYDFGYDADDLVIACIIARVIAPSYSI